MKPADLWQPVRDELARWHPAGLTPELWLRDDDAINPSSRLDRLIVLTEEFHIPLALAIVPKLTGTALARHLEGLPHVHPVIHGWAHANHAPWPAKKEELGAHRPRKSVLRDIVKGRERLAELHGERLVPLLVPPWNRIDPSLLDHLPGLGFRGLSTFGHKLASRAGLVVINAHIDFIDWHGTMACFDHARLVAELAQELAQARGQGGRPIGILSHHLDNDEMGYRFLRDLFTVAPPELVRWRTPGELI
jgi:hypothetical protein